MHNQRTAQGRNASLFYVMMGYNPHAIPSVYPSTPVSAGETCLKLLKKVHKEALAAHELARQRMAEHIIRGFTPFRKGQRVWLDAKNLHFLADSKKFAMK